MTDGIFILACVLAFCSWWIAIIEIITVHSFTTFFFRIGITAYNKTITIDTKNLQFLNNRTIKKTEGKFQFSKDHKVYFISQFFLFKLFRVSTPFPFKAIGEIRTDNQIEIIGRIPIGTSLFFLFWLLGWSAGAIGASSGIEGMAHLGSLLFGWTFAGIIFLISYYVEKGRMDQMVTELETIINAHNNDYE